MVGFKNEKLFELESVRGFKRILKRLKMNKNLISKPRIQGIFV